MDLDDMDFNISQLENEGWLSAAHCFREARAEIVRLQAEINTLRNFLTSIQFTVGMALADKPADPGPGS
jgi:hypothetical protein